MWFGIIMVCLASAADPTSGACDPDNSVFSAKSEQAAFSSEDQCYAVSQQVFVNAILPSLKESGKMVKGESYHIQIICHPEAGDEQPQQQEEDKDPVEHKA